MVRVAMVVFALMSALLMAGCGSAEAADITLEYASPDYPEDTIAIYAGPGGEVRTIAPNGQGFLTLDGQTYVIFTRGGPEPSVTKLQDYLAVGAELREQLIEVGVMVRDGADTPYTLEERGAQAIGPWNGDRYEIDPRESGPTDDIVISTDPALADVREVAGPAFVTLNRISGAVLVFPGEFTRLTEQVLANGVPLRINGLELQSVSREPIPDEQFALPGPVLDRAALRDRMAP